MTLLQSILLAIIEGVTEFLPISSTGHMIIASAAMHIEKDSFVKLFTVAIQFGAILSVLVLYYKRFFQSLDFYWKIGVAFLPAVIFGLLLNDFVDSMLERVDVVGYTLLLGGIVLLFVDKWFSSNEQSNNTKATEITWKAAVSIGLFQCLAMVPGVSRSASTIIGGLTQKLNRKTAAEFSFFLAVPTMFAATVKKMWDGKELLMQHNDQLGLLLLGNLVAFIVAMLAIKFFINFLTRYGFRLFGLYRIVVGGIILILFYSGVQLHMG